MPKTKRKLYTSAEETLVLQDYDISQTTPTSPSPSLTSGMSPEHTEESNEVAQITSACGQNDFQLSPLHSQSLSAELKLAFPCTPKGEADFNNFDGSTPALSSSPCPPSKKLCSLEICPGKDNTQLLNGGLMAESTTVKEKHQVGQKSGADLPGSQEDKHKKAGEKTAHEYSKQVSEAGKVELAEDADRRCQPLEHSSPKCDIKTRSAGSTVLSSKADQAERSGCTLSGFMTLTTRNGDAMVHSLLPSLLPRGHGSGLQNLNTCLTGSDCNWFQILSTALPHLPSSQHPASSTDTAGTVLPSSTDSISLSACEAAPASTSAPVSSATTFSSTITSSSSTNNTSTTGASLVSDPLLTLITAGAVDVQHPFQAVHLPVSVSTSTPRYLYASNPHTGQLVLVSPVGDLNAISSLQLHLQQQQQQHQLQQQQQSSHPHPEQSLPLIQLTPLQQGLQVGQNQQQTLAQKVPPPLQASQQPNTQVAMVSAMLAKQLTSGGILSNASVSKTHENMAPVAAAKELLALASSAHSKPSATSSIMPPFLKASTGISEEEPVRENHNMKERRRRARIKEACDLMRQLVPGMSDKTDKATVFEFSARYIHFLKNFVGGHHDKEFLIKYSPY